MKDITKIVRHAQIYVGAVVCGLSSLLSVVTSVAQQLAEPMAQVQFTGTPVPKIETCFRVNFDKSGTEYSHQGSLDFGDVFRSDGGQCLTSKIAALKANFLYRYHPDPSVLSG